MPGFDQISPPAAKEAPASPRQVRLGQVLFVLYLLFYGGFMFLNAFDPEAMEQTPLAGVNLAVLYGLALIAVAFLLALVYDAACRLLARPSAGPAPNGEAPASASRRPQDGEAAL